MTKFICFVGVIEIVDAPADTPEDEVANIARENVFKRRADYAEHDFGVSIEAVDYE